MGEPGTKEVLNLADLEAAGGIHTGRKHILSLLVENKPGVLARIAGLFSRRGFNIQTLAVGPTDDLAANVVEVRTVSGLRRDPADERRFHLTSSCGVCGKAALEHVRIAAPPPAAPSAPVTPELVLRLPAEAGARQRDR